MNRHRFAAALLAALAGSTLLLSASGPAVAGPTAPEGWQAVAGGLDHTCGIQMDGSPWCWGDNSFGQLGIGTNADSWLPAQVSPGTAWVFATGGYFFSCGIQPSRILWCWGSDDSGQLGDGLMPDSWVPVPVS